MSEINAWQLVLKISAVCVKCKQKFEFRAKHGFSTNEPTVSNDSYEIRIPVDYPPEVVADDDDDRLLH